MTPVGDCVCQCLRVSTNDGWVTGMASHL